MNKEIKSVLSKTARIAGVTCVAAGAVAIMTSGAALKALVEGGKYMVNTIQKIAKETENPEEIPGEIVTDSVEEVTATEETAAEEV